MRTRRLSSEPTSIHTTIREVESKQCDQHHAPHANRRLRTRLKEPDKGPRHAQHPPNTPLTPAAACPASRCKRRLGCCSRSATPRMSVRAG